MSHPIDPFAAEHPSIAQRLLLAPVACIDCETYVPLGWVEYGTVHCYKNVGATGVIYGHRALTEVITSIKDSIYNSVQFSLSKDTP